MKIYTETQKLWKIHGDKQINSNYSADPSQSIINSIETEPNCGIRAIPKITLLYEEPPFIQVC